MQRSGYFWDRCFITEAANNAKGLRSGLSADSFDLIAVSVSHEPDLLLLPAFLTSAGIPLFASDRTQRDPVVLLGGPLTLLNTNFVNPLVDLVCYGEGDTAFPQLINLMGVTLQEKADRISLLKQLATVQNISQAITTSTTISTKTTPLSFPTHSAAISEDYAFSKLFMLELTRGCTKRCPYCIVPAGMGKFRSFDTEKILTTIEVGAKHTSRFGLVGAAAAWHPDLSTILETLIAKNYEATFSSLYIERIDDFLAISLKKLGQRTITLGLESALEEERFSIGKRFTNEQLFLAITHLANAEIRNIRFYVILGLPGGANCLEEAKALIELSENIQKRFPTIAFSYSINPFTPKPGTVWSHQAMAPNQYDKAVQLIRKKISRKNQLSVYSLREATLTTLINRIPIVNQATDVSLYQEISPSLSKNIQLLKKIYPEISTKEIAATQTPWQEIIVQ
jgi:radical SAM superfamily enzyme YgiQ (UPF0313 family)